MYKEDFYYDFGVGDLCGVDEAGRGPLAGPVFAAAVILDCDNKIEGLDDSKKLTAAKRDILYDEIVQKSTAYAIGVATVFEIDSLNILKATFLAMQRAVDSIDVKPDLIIVDGSSNPALKFHSKCIVKGDCKYASIAAASILAKVSRDRYMIELSKKYPNYGFDKHKGYGTKFHYEMIKKYGYCKEHRKSFLNKVLSHSHSYDIGMQGEYYARCYLINKQYNILDINYKGTYGEIDIIYKNKNTIHFTEVKTRNVNSKVLGIESVDYNKRQRIIKTAYEYMQEKQIDLQPVFDVIDIKSTGKKSLKVTDFRHIENAFDVEEVIL